MSLSEPRIGEPGRSTMQAVWENLHLSLAGVSYWDNKPVDFRLTKNRTTLWRVVCEMRSDDNRKRVAAGFEPLHFVEPISVVRAHQKVQNHYGGSAGCDLTNIYHQHCEACAEGRSTYPSLRGPDYERNHGPIRKKVAREIAADRAYRKNRDGDLARMLYPEARTE